MFNRTYTFQNINRNVVHPNISLDTIELRHNTTVEIVELNDSSDECDEKTNSNFVDEAELHPWSFISRELIADEESYRINKRARERRRLNNDIEDIITNGTDSQVRSPGRIYPSFYSFDKDYLNDNDKLYVSRQVNCFTIPNHLGTSSTSSEDPSGDRVQCGDAIPNQDRSEKEDYDEVYFSQDHKTDKRTIWIYSFKNKHILSEKDYVLTDIGSRDTSSSDELETEPIKDSKKNKSVTPIPFVPRLNLNIGSILPTVTEVTEPTKYSSAAIINSPAQDNATPIKTTDRSKVDSNLTEVNKLLNWKSLSPRVKIKELSPSGKIVYCEPKIVVTNRETSSEGTDDLQHIDNESYRDDIEKTKDTLVIQKPRINVYSKPLTNCFAISDPIEKLEGNWIDESSSTKGYKKTTPVNFELDLPSQNIVATPAPAIIDQVTNDFFINNMSLLKPAEWKEYMPITASMHSLELSITSVDSKKSWFMKLFKCFKCSRD